MSIAIIVPNRDTSLLTTLLKRQLPNVDIQTYPDISDPTDITFAIVWDHPQDIWKPFVNLKVIASLGAGIDHLLFDPTLPLSPQVVRIVDEELVISMRRYVLLMVLDYHRKMDHYRKNQAKQIWDTNKAVERKLKIGVLGLGQLGKDIAIHLANLNFDIFGFSNSPKLIPGVKTYNAQEEQMNIFLSQINLLINILPLTYNTKGILSKSLFDQLTSGTYLINVGRGAHLVDADLIEAISNGQISGAALDVFNEEPLPGSHPFWKMKEITITPHIASVTNLQSVVTQLAQNYNYMVNGKPLLNKVDIKRGY